MNCMFEGKVAVITGGAGGLGHGIALACLREGMKIVISGRREQALREMEERLLAECPGGKIFIKTCDVSREDSVRALLEATLRAYGHVNFLFNNAGIMYPKTFENLTGADWEKFIGIDIFGVINGMKVFLPELKKNEDVAYMINTGGLGCVTFSPAMSHYSAAKAATLLISGCLQKELLLEGSKVKVMEIIPATVFSGLMKTKENAPDADMNEIERSQRDLLYRATGGDTPETVAYAREKFGTITDEEAGEIILDALKKGKNFCLTQERAGTAAENFAKTLINGYLT